MAGKVVIDTEINAETVTRGFDEIQRDISKTIAAQEKLQARFDKFKETGGDTKSRTFQAMQYDAAQLENRLEDLNEELAKAGTGGGARIPDLMDRIRNSSSKASKSVLKMGDSVRTSAKSFSKALKTILGYAIGIRSIYILIGKFRSALTESIKNLAQFNNGANDVNTAMSNITSSLSAFKNSIGAAFAPILTVVEPVLTMLIDKLTQAMTVLGQFIAAMTGASTFTKAVKVQKDYAQALNATAKSAKNAKGQLAGFDELNIVSQNTSGAGAEAVDVNQMFDVVPIESKIKDMADRVRNIFAGLKTNIADWFATLNFNPLIESLAKLRDAARPLIDTLGNGLKWVLDNVLEPIAKWSIEDALPAWFDMTAKAAESFDTVLKALKPTFDYVWNNLLVPLAKWSGEAFIGFLNMMGNAFDTVAEIFNERGTDIKDIIKGIFDVLKVVWNANIKPLLDVVLYVVKAVIDNIGNIINHLLQTLHGVVEFIAGVFTADWQRAWNGIKDILKGVVNLLIDIWEGAVNAIIGAINKISIDVPEGIPVLGGKHIGFNLTEMHIPRLAQGTVIPRQASEFLAVLGDNNRETEVVSPISTIKQALIDAMRESQGAGDISLTINLDGEQVYRSVVNRNNQFFNRTGSSELYV